MAPKLQVDHIIPHARGHQYERKGVDLDAIENLMPACRKCNNFKHNNSLEGFRRDLGESIARARKYSVNFNNAERFGLISIHPQERIIFHFEKIGGTVDL
jgi:5-methylcytosine-specific restriction endonuclease McrA